MVKKKTIQETSLAEPVAVEHVGTMSNLRDRLEDAKTHEGIIGYILKNSTSAAIDLKDPAKLVDYALLSSVMMDTATRISDTFDLGETKSVVLRGKNVKILSLSIGDDKVSVIMENIANSDDILRKLTA